MTEAVGNVLRPPSRTSKAATTNEEILFSYVGFTQKGLTVISGAGVLKTGTALKVSGTPGKYTGAAKADVADVVAILRKDVDATSQDMLANYVLHGTLKGVMVKYTDDDTLSAGELAALATVLGGKYNPIHDTLSY